MNERNQLLEYRQWNENMLAATKDATTRKHLNQHVDDIDFQLETDPPRPKPMCGWEKSIRQHSYPCPRGNIMCNLAYEEWIAIPQTNRPIRAAIPKIR